MALQIGFAMTVDQFGCFVHALILLFLSQSWKFRKTTSEELRKKFEDSEAGIFSEYG
jgi:hypothetical protein